MIDLSEESGRRKRRGRWRRLWWRRGRPVWRKAEWPVVWALALAALVLGAIGFGEYYRWLGADKSVFDFWYESLQLFVLESGKVETTELGRWRPTSLEVARWLAPAVTVYTATKALLSIFSEQLTLMRLWGYRRHIVICGLGRRGQLLCRDFSREGWRVVVIERDANNEQIDRCREEGAIVLVGAADRTLLRKARVHRATRLYAVAGDDGANAEVAGLARELVKERGGDLTCHAHVGEPRLRDLLAERESMSARGDGAGGFHQEFFSVFQVGARALLREHPPFEREEGGGVRPAHLLVVGLGRMGQHLVAHAAGKWDGVGLPSLGKLPVIVADSHVEERVGELLFRHPQVGSVCELTEWKVDVYSPQFQLAAPLFDAAGRCPVTAAYICLDNDAHSLYAALALARAMRQHHVPAAAPRERGGHTSPDASSAAIVVRMADDAGLATLLRGEGGGCYAGLRPFNLLEQTCQEMLRPGAPIEAIAEGLHADYLRDRRSRGQTRAENPALVPWEELPESLRESNRRRAEHLRSQLEAIGCAVGRLSDGAAPFKFSPEEVERMAEMEHERWYDDLWSEGWTYHAGPKQFELKRSPNLLPWEQLSDETKEFNRRIVRSIPRVLADAGFSVYRKGAPKKRKGSH